MNANEIEFLEGGSYISFATRKRSGEWVATPVWFAPDRGSYYVFSAGNAGKVKRLRNFSESRIAACTMSGTLTGEWRDTHAYVLDKPADQRHCPGRPATQVRLADAAGRFFLPAHRQDGSRAYIRIKP